MVLISGGGISVAVDREGRGERNAEFLFSLAIEPGGASVFLYARL
jgi:glycerate-2-kinase